jgi:hypothetical protein
METAQAITTAVGIAELALKVGQLVRRVFRAKAEAEELSCRAQDAGNLAKVIKEVIDDRKAAIDNSSRSPVERSILQVIEKSLTGCQSRLTLINTTLRPFEDTQPSDIPHELKVGIKFVRAEDFLKEQQSQLDKHFRDLTLSFGVLNSFDLHVLRRNNVRSDLTFNRSTHNGTFIGPGGARRIAEAPQRQSTVKVSSDITSTDPYGWNLLHHAANKLDLRTVQELLRSPQARESEFLNAVTPSTGETALILAAKHACSKKAVDVAQALIEQGCKMDLTDSSKVGEAGPVGRSALYHAVDGPAGDKNRVKFVFALVDGGVNVEQLRQDYPKKYKKLQEFEKSGHFQELSQQNQELSQQNQELSQQRRRNTIAIVNAEEGLQGAAADRQRQNSMPALFASQRAPSRKDSVISWFSSTGEKLARTVSNSTQDSTNSKERKSSKGYG